MGEAKSAEGGAGGRAVTAGRSSDVGAKSNPRVLVTRSERQSSELATKLVELGLEPVVVPAIEVAPPSSYAVLDEALARLESFQWVVFTSANAVEAMRGRMKAGAFSSRALPRIAAIGPATARALEAIGLAVDLVPAQAVAESLRDALVPHAVQSDGSPARFLLARAEEARDVVPEALRAAGAEVVVAPAYRTVVPAESVELIRDLFGGRAGVAAITFTSSSTVRNLLALCEAAGVKLPVEVLRVSIGPITSETLRGLGYPPHAEAIEASVVALAEAVRQAIDASGR
ncbi:MAG TPA: uroporphyrinogen-III synthase [Acidobacteriaceae bacterium]|nr:uroporphyrinogen-III synthase [Acidobacteriaceae bacterium]